MLKGATLFAIWFDQPHRPTRDADFLGFGTPDPARLATIVRDLCAIESDDGLHFEPRSIEVEAIREHASYEGLRIRLHALLGTARCHVQWDVGFGDAVTPSPLESEFPALLDDMPRPRLRVYPRETVFAEKLEAIATLGIANSRMKDYYDLLALAREGAMNKTVLGTAIRATFERRRTELPRRAPFGLSEAFSADAQKRAQWEAFLRRNRLPAPDLTTVVEELRGFVLTLGL